MCPNFVLREEFIDKCIEADIAAGLELIKDCAFQNLDEMSDNDSPPVLTKQATNSITTTADNSVSIVTTCTGTITVASNSSDSFIKTTTIVTPSSSSVSDSTQITSASSNTSVLSSSKNVASDTKSTTSVITGSGGTATAAAVTSASGSNAETASSTSSTPQLAPKSRRKPTSRAKKDSVDKTKTSTTVVSSSSAAQMVPQAPLMLTSASPGQFMLVHHNGQCYMMSATQYFGTNQQVAAVRPQQQQHQQLCAPATSCTTTITTSAQDFFKVVQQQQATNTMSSQQQYVQSSFVASSATLGQLARNEIYCQDLKVCSCRCAKKGLKKEISVAVVATSTHMLSTTVTTTVTTTTSSTIGQGNDASSGRSAQLQQSHQQLGTPSIQQMQPSMFPQGIQLRTPPGSSGIVFQMPSGAYTYVHQLVTPQQRTSIAIPQQQPIPACIGQAVTANQPQNQQQQQPSPTSSPTQKVTSTIAESNSKQTSNNISKESTIIERRGSNASPTADKESQPLAQMISIPPTTSVKNTETLPKNVRGGAKHAGNGRKTNTVRIATPQPIAPTNLVPVGAPVPMMVMSAPMPQLSSFGGHAAVPFMGPNGQIIHQQLITNTPVPTHQMIPVFQQQQQNATHFPISQSAPTQVQDIVSHDSEKTVADDDNGYIDSGIENEPPPLLVQGESKDALDIHMMFTREAEKYYQKTGRKGKIVHLIEGFEIEESDEPFPCDPPCRLSDWLLSEMEDKNGRKVSKECRWSTSPKKVIGKKDTEPTLEINTEKVEIKKGRSKASPAKSEASSEKAEKKTRKRKTNELDRLLQMDFGPSHGRLSDIMQKSVYKPNKENKETLLPPPLPPPTKSYLTKPKGRPPSSSVDKQKLEKNEISEPVMERFIIEDVVDISPKAVTKKCEESPATADQSLNSSKSSADTATGSLLISFSDEELDTERCNYCNGLLRLKRLENHPQYCSKKCRKLWKKNPTINEEQVGRSFNMSPRLPVIRSTDTSPINKDIGPTVTVQNLSIVSEPSSSDNFFPGSTIDLQQRTPPTLTLKMVSPQQAEIVKSPRGLSTSYSLGEWSKMPSTSVSPAVAVASTTEHAPMDFLSRPTKTWTCDEVASWVSSVTSNEDCANTFRNQDIDGQSLLLLPDNAHNNLVTLLGLKLGPVVKILNALKELSSKSINAS
uniref:SAM domain-containing protein n=1 Tax=Onchocerca volvulus TaxID=6282 RepID=A0A8R1XQ79_ONCVO